MFKYALLLALVTLGACQERSHKKQNQYVDPFAMIDKHLSHSLAYHYLWPWGQLIKAAAAMDLEDALEDPQIISDSHKYQINLLVERFKPEELKIKVKNRYIVVEGKHKVSESDNKFMANHFIQRFALPPGTRQEEVTAVLNEKNVLSITAPKHEVPPPTPEREVPIEVTLPTEEVEIEDKKEVLPEKEESKEPLQTSSVAPLEQIETEATTANQQHVGKIRKKDLKTTTKVVKDNEVTKVLEENDSRYPPVYVYETELED